MDQEAEEHIVSKHIGSSFDAFLEEDGMREEVTAAAVKRVIAWQIAQAMKARKVSKTEMAARMRTSRMVVNRLLDENDTSVTLATWRGPAWRRGLRCGSSWVRRWCSLWLKLASSALPVSASSYRFSSKRS